MKHPMQIEVPTNKRAFISTSQKMEKITECTKNVQLVSCLHFCRKPAIKPWKRTQIKLGRKQRVIVTMVIELERVSGW